MLYLRLALKNLKFNWYRTRLSILAVALAAVVMIGATSLESGYPVQRAAGWRNFLEADIVAYAGEYYLGAERAAGGSTEFEWSQLESRTPSIIGALQPEFGTDGYLRPVQGRYTPFTEAELEAVRQVEGVAAVNPVYALPVRTTVDGRTLVTQVRSRRDRSAPWHRERMPVWVNRRAGTGLKKGDKLTLHIPEWRGFLDSQPNYNLTDTETVRAYVAGTYQFQTGEQARLYNKQGELQLDSDGRPVYVPVYWDEPEFLCQLKDVMALFGLTSREMRLSPPVYQLGIEVEQLYYARSVAEKVQSALKGRTVLTVPRQVELMSHQVRAVQTGSSVEYIRSAGNRVAIPAGLYPLFVALAFVLAGMLLMANMNLLVTQRQRDLGILKALGTSSRELVLIMLFESTAISVIGALVGLLAFLPVLIMLLLSADVGLEILLREALVDYGTVLATAVAVGAVFGTVPAWRAARETVTELLR
jgi:hypothetical protein